MAGHEALCWRAEGSAERDLWKTQSDREPLNQKSGQVSVSKITIQGDNGIEANLRRYPAPAALQGDQEVREFGSVKVDVRGTSVTRKGRVVPLSAREFQLRKYFLQHPDATLSREVLLKVVWGYSTGTYTRTVDVHVASLRQKLEDEPRRPNFFVTVSDWAISLWHEGPR